MALASLATATAARAAAAVAAEDNKRNAYYLPPPRLLLDSQEEEKQQQQQQRRDEDDSDNSSMDIELSSNGNATKLAIAMDNSNVIDTIENEVARAHDLLDLELSGHGFRRSPSAAAATSMSQQQQQGSLYANMPAGVRSAIVASAAIVLTSLATLMVIFVACRWRQHRRRKFSYLKTYNAMKSKLPQASPSTVAACNGGNSCNCNGNGSNSCHNSHKLATVSCNTPVHHHHNQHQQLLFKREGSTTLSTCSSSLTTTATSNVATAAAAAATTTTTVAAAAASTATGGRGMGGVNSLALTLRSTHQKLNTMDPNSPEVQEYLFDTLRKTFDK